MAPAHPNVGACDEMDQLKMRLNADKINAESDINDNENNNTVKIIRNGEIDEEFDLAKYEAMNFIPQIRWPDLIVQISLHLVSIYGLYLLFTNKLKFYTIIFGELSYIIYIEKSFIISYKIV